jgi:sulfate transport system permease protein
VSASTSIATAFDPDGARVLAARTTRRRASVLPGFGLSLGFTLVYLSLIVLIPLSAAFFKTAQMTWPAFVETVTAPRALASYRLTFGASLAARRPTRVRAARRVGADALSVPGRRIADALVDLPFALPTAVAGIALTGLFAPTDGSARRCRRPASRSRSRRSASTSR